jgi:hypothetical protein
MRGGPPPLQCSKRTLEGLIATGHERGPPPLQHTEGALGGLIIAGHVRAFTTPGAYWASGEAGALGVRR